MRNRPDKGFSSQILCRADRLDQKRGFLGASQGLFAE